MYTARILNNSATLNYFQEMSAAEFVPGENLTLIFRLHQPDINLRYIPNSSAIVTFTFNLSDGTTLDVVGVPNSDDRSIMTISISAANSALLLGGNVPFEIDMTGDGSNIKKGLIQNALQRIQEN